MRETWVYRDAATARGHPAKTTSQSTFHGDGWIYLAFCVATLRRKRQGELFPVIVTSFRIPGNDITRGGKGNRVKDSERD
jgi:hypothetical protein